jgi:hypothetical protein
MTTSNINKKFNNLLENELAGFFDMLIETSQNQENFEFSKENLVELANGYFMFSVTSKKPKAEKVKKERKELSDEERCQETKKDGSRCNGSKTKKEEHQNTEYATMCSLHINSAKKPKVVKEETSSTVDEIEKPVAEEETPKKPKKATKKQSKKEIIEEEEL